MDHHRSVAILEDEAFIALERIATLLDARNIPFVVHSASYANSGFHDPIFKGHGSQSLPRLPSCATQFMPFWQWQTAMTCRGRLKPDKSQPHHEIRRSNQGAIVGLEFSRHDGTKWKMPRLGSRGAIHHWPRGQLYPYKSIGLGVAL
ncbi:hypothetical protein [Mesorhizobium sp. M0030]|uniref:hypothetical protein n=1 Tax=Mesorhizobium sp. M0030 TaxID=2956851 RepID=UPI00333CB1A5